MDWNDTAWSDREHGTVTEEEQEAMDAYVLAMKWFKDERDKVQKKTFTKWLNKYLVKSRRHVDNLYEDLRDGHNLIALLEVLSGETLPREGEYMSHMRLPREKGRMRFHRLQNVQIALDFLKKRKLKLVNIRNDDITDGNPKLTLGLIWTIILHFQIEDIAIEGEDDVTAKQALMLWAQRNVEGYDDIAVTNFTKSWRDGKAFNAIIHRNRPDLVDMDEVRKSGNNANLENAFSVAEKELGVTRLLDSEDVDVEKPDERSLITYVSSLYDVFPKVPPFPISITTEEWHYTWEEYRILVTSILEWIQKKIIILRKRDDIPCTAITEAKNLIHEIKRFQEEELTRKEADKNLVRPKYTDLEVMQQKSLGRFEIAEGYAPDKVDAAWSALMTANDEREGALTAEYRRLEKLNGLVVKITNEAAQCRRKLDDAEKLIKITETEGDDSEEIQRRICTFLDTSEKGIRVMFVDVQTLKDAEYHQAEDMYKTVFLLHEKWVALRSSYTAALKEAPNVRAAILARLRPRLENTNEYKSLQNALKWVADKTHETESFPVGQDLPTTEAQHKRFKRLEDEVEDFESEVKKACKGKDEFQDNSNDFDRYTRDLSRLETNYSQLQSVAKTREGQIWTLLKFIREANEHIMWMNRIESDETGRDLTEYLSDATPLERRLERLKDDMGSRSVHFQSTVQDGELLVRHDHPAKSTVQAYLTTLSNQWEWISSLRMCLLEHVEILNLYSKFHNDCTDAEKFLRDRETELEEKMNEIGPDAPAERTEYLFQEIFREYAQLKGELDKFKTTVVDLITRSKRIPCVENRHLAVPRGSKQTAQALCSYKHMNLAIAKGENCTLVAKPQLIKWTVINSVSQQGDAPSVIFILPPPSTRSISRAQALDRNYTALLEMWRDHHARARLLVVINSLQRKIKTVMSWTTESYRLMTPNERRNAIKVLKDGLKSVEETDSDDPSLTVKIASLRVEVQRCIKHAESLGKQFEQDDQDEEQCRTYISRLNVILRRLNTIDGVVSVRVKTALPREVASMQHVIHDHESSVVEMKTLEPQYVDLRDGSKVILENDDCKAPSKRELGDHVDVVEKKWEKTWNVSTLYLDKLKMVYLVLQSTKEAEKVVSHVETRIEENREIPEDSESLRKQQTVFKSVNMKTRGLRDTLEQNEPLISSLQRDADHAKEIGSRLVKVVHGPHTQVTEDVDAKKYTADVTNVVNRWQVCKVFVEDRLTKFNDLLPKAEQSEAEEQRTRSLIDRLNKLLATLDSIQTSQEAQMTVWLPRSVPALEQAEETQGVVVKRVEDLKPEYDSAQTVVVNFINEEATGTASSLSFLRDTLHKVQEKWATVWLMTHVYFEKIKGLLYTQSAIIECEKTVVEYEKVLHDRSHPTKDVDTLRKRNDIFQKLAADIPIHDSNFEALAKNLISTREVTSQLPAQLDERCNTDLDTYSADIEDLETRWEGAKKKLMAFADDVKIRLPKMEKAAAQERLLSNLLTRIRALSNALDTLTQSQTARMDVSLPTETRGLQKCLSQQKDVQNRLTALSSDYEPLVTEVRNVLQREVLNSPTAATVKDETDKMIEKWGNLNQTTALCFAKIKVLHEVSQLMHDVTVVVTKYEQTLDANEHLHENDLNALRKQEAVLKVLVKEVPSHDPKFPDVSETLEVAETTARKLAEASGIAEKDVPHRQNEYSSMEQRWNEAKKRLTARLHLLAQCIPLVEKTASEEGNASSLLPGVEAMIHDLERLESAQVVRADVMLPSDANAVSRILQQQKTTFSQFQNDITLRYTTILVQCRPLVEKRDSTAPSVSKLCVLVAKMEEKYKVVGVLIKQYLIKVELIFELLSRLAVVKPILKKYEEEVAQTKPNCNRDLPELIEYLQTLQNLIADIPIHDSNFDTLAKKLTSTREVISQLPAQPDEHCNTDLDTYTTDIEDLETRWEEAKKKIKALADDVKIRLPKMEKAAAQERLLSNLLTRIRALSNALDTLSQSQTARMEVSLPTETRGLQKCLAQQKEVQNRLTTLASDYEPLVTEVRNVLQREVLNSPTAETVKDEADKMIEKWENLNQTTALFFAKIKVLHDVSDLMHDVTVVVTKYEQTLDANEHLPKNDLNALRKQEAVLKVLVKEVPSHDPKFPDVSETLEVAEATARKLAEASRIAEKDVPHWQNEYSSMEERWNEAKKRLTARLHLLAQCIPLVEKTASEEGTASSLLPGVEAMIHDLERLESAQVVHADVMLPSDANAVSRILQQQKTTLSQFQDDVTPRYTTILVQCRPLVEKKDSTAPSVAKLYVLVAKMEEKYNVVDVLVKGYLIKVGLIFDLLNRLAVVKPILKKYDEEVAQTKPNCNRDLPELMEYLQTLQKLVSDIPIHDSKFDELAKKLISTREDFSQLPAQLAERSDTDLDTYSTDIEDLETRWEDAKKKLMALVDDMKILLPKLEKAAAQEKLLSNLLARIRALSNALDALTQSQTARMEVSLPTETRGLQKCLAQQKDVQNRLSDLSSDYEPLVLEVRNVLQQEVLNSPTAATVKDESDRMVEKWENLNQTTALFFAKIKVLHDVSQLMHDVTVVVTKYEQTLDANEHLPENDLNALRKQEAVLKVLINEVPSHDPKFPDVNETLEIAEGTARKLATASGIAEKDVPHRQNEYSNMEDRWNEAKKRLNARLHLLAQCIPLVEKTASEEGTASSLLPCVEAIIHELERLESAQVVRADVMLPTDANAVSRILQQQKTTLSQFQDDVTLRYTTILVQCRPLVEKEDSTAPSVAKLCVLVAKMEGKYNVVDVLVKKYMIKVELIFELLSRLVVVRPILKKYEAEVAKANPSCNKDLSELREHLQTLQTLKAGVPVEDPKFGAVVTALKHAKENPDKSDKPDQDINAHETECDDVIDRWGKVKKQLDTNLAEIEAMIPNAENAASIETKCKELLPSLRKQISEMDTLEHATRTRIGMCLPSKPESVDKAIAQQKITTDRLDALEPQYQKLLTAVIVVLKSVGDDTPSTAQLRNEQNVAEKKWETVRYLCQIYLQKLHCLRDAAKKSQTARETIRVYDTHLVTLDAISGDIPGLKEQVAVLEKLEKEISKHEPEFKTFTRSVLTLKECGDKLGKDSGEEDLDTPHYEDISKDLDERWKEAKDQVRTRLDYVRVGLEKLTEYEDASKKQKDKLDKTESVLDNDKLRKIKTESKEIAQQIEQHEKLDDDLDGQKPELDKLMVLATEFDETAKKYEDTVAKFEPRDADLADKKKEGSKTITRIIIVEVTTITRKYDKLKNLISERVDTYKVDYDKAKDREMPSQKLLKGSSSSKLGPQEAARREEEERNSKTTIITETTTTTTTKKTRLRKDIYFDTAFRNQASLLDLREAGCVSEETTEQLEIGVVDEEEVAPSLQRYLTGDQPISGVIIKKADNKTMSINEAMIRGIMLAGTGLGLLEAQAACGNIIDPHTGEMMSVNQAIEKGLVEKKYEDALQRAEKAVFGFVDPVTRKTLSLYEAMKKNFVVEGHGIRLLEAQIATGGLIDPRANHRVPISVAYKRGLFDERMNAILEDPSDDTKGFFDPNTKKNHTYLELMRKSKVDPVTGVRLLEIAREDIDLRIVTMELTEIITTTTKRRSRHDIRFKTGFRRDASLVDIYDAGLITEKQMVGLEEGAILEEDLSSQLRQYLFGGEEPIAGVILQATGERLSINEAVRRTIIKRGTGIELLEAQAATGNIIDPKTATKLSVDEAAKSGLIDRLHVDTLQRAERAVYGYKLPGTNKVLSLFEAMKKGLVVESRGIRLLEAQIATGGLIDPRASHRVPISVAYKRGLFDERMNQILEDPSDDTKGFFDPNTLENLSYLELMERCITDEETGLRFLVLEEKKKKRRSKREETFTKETQRERTKKKDTVKKSLSEEKSDANGKTSKKTITVEKITVTHEVSKKRETVDGSRDDITFKTGYRREAKLADLVKTGIVSKETADKLEHGAIKHSDVYQQIKRNLVGDEPIGGILVKSTGEKLSVSEAAKRGFLMRGTALQFLEAQAAIGNIIDPKSGERMGVMDSYSSGLIERSHIDPLERAERAVLGYKEKGTMNVLSLFECMRKGLVTESRGIRLLEAQIATGGLIDPRLNHRVPISVAYKQGIFDERMNDILEDPSDDTKGFFDPNTKKNSSYLDLIQQCIVDPKTGVKLLEVKGQDGGGTGTLRKRNDIRFKTGFLKTASVMDLLEAGILTEETVVALEKGIIEEEDVARSIHQYLHGEHPIAGLMLEATGEKISILEGIQQGIIKRGTGLELLEAQAATGTIIDPRTGDRMSVTDAFSKGLVDNTQRDALERAQRAVTGYRDPISGKTLSLFAAMKKGYVTQSRGIRLLEAQIATGGLIDPNASHRVPISVAYRRGIFDEKFYQILEDPSDDTKGFFDPNTQANLTYLELMGRCQTEQHTGMVFLVLQDTKTSKRSKRGSSSRKKHRTTQRTRKVVIVDPDTGKELSVREAHKKGLIDGATARQLMEQEGEWQESEEITTKSGKKVPADQAIMDTKTGANISIDDALDQSLVDKGTANKFKLGEISADELSSRLTLLSCGSQGPIGAIMDLKKNECITISEAEKRRLVDGTTAQRLLEAQAATGGIGHPANSDRLSIADAVSLGIIGRRMGEKIEKAELAYKGFQDRRTKELMSLGEAMKRSLCFYDAGMKFLEYQYVTGGLVDYRDGSRISVDEAVERKWIDQRQADRLTDLRRYARSIVDLKTNLLLTYPEALEQAQLDGKTGLRVMQALPRLERNARMAGGLMIRAGSMQSSLASSLASSRAESPVGSPKRRGSFDEDSFPLSPSSRK